MKAQFGDSLFILQSAQKFLRNILKLCAVCQFTNASKCDIIILQKNKKEFKNYENI